MWGGGWLLCRTPSHHRLSHYVGKQLRVSLPTQRLCSLAVPHGRDSHGDDLPQRSQIGWTVFSILHLKKQGVYKHLRKLFAPTESNKTRPSGKCHSSMLVCVLTCCTKEILMLSYKSAGSSSLYSRLPPFHSLILKNSAREPLGTQSQCHSHTKACPGLTVCNWKPLPTFIPFTLLNFSIEFICFQLHPLHEC